MLTSFWKKKTALMIGIDIGSHSAKAVLLNQNNDGYVLEAVACVSMPRGAVIDREIQDIEAVGKVIATLRKRLDSSVTQVASAVSGQTVITKTIFMDVALSEQELASQIEIEADSLIPFPLDEVSLDFESLDVNESNPSKINVLLSAARTESVEARVSALQSGGFSTKVIDVESYALSRAFDLSLGSLPDDALDKVVATVDVGAMMTLFSVTESGEHIYSRDQLFGGEQFTRSIASFYNKSFEEAESEKVLGKLPENYTDDVLLPFQRIILQQVRRAIQMFLTSSGKENIDYLLLSGGCALVEGVQKLLHDELNIPTYLADPFVQMQVSDKVDSEQLEISAATYMVASGLALRSFSPWHI
jgi:type IV pilus assembly protein PilM